jgi:hypothetical protein
MNIGARRRAASIHINFTLLSCAPVKRFHFREMPPAQRFENVPAITHYIKVVFVKATVARWRR